MNKKLNWERVNVENVDELRKAQGYEPHGRPSKKVATSSTGERTKPKHIPKEKCPICKALISPGEVRRHALQKHSSEKSKIFSLLGKK